MEADNISHGHSNDLISSQLQSKVKLECNFEVLAQMVEWLTGIPEGAKVQIPLESTVFC